MIYFYVIRDRYNQNNVAVATISFVHELIVREEEHRVTVLQEIFGAIRPELIEPLAEIALLLEPDARLRVRNIRNFLMCPFFLELNLTTCKGLVKNREDLPILNDDISVTELSDINDTIMLIVRVCYVEALFMKTCFLAIELFYQLFGYHVVNKSQFTLFALLCIWFAEGLLGGTVYRLNRLNHNAAQLGFNGNFELDILNVITKEQGKMSYKSCFDILPSRQLLIKAKDILLDSISYPESSEVLSINLLLEETQGEVFDREERFLFSYEDWGIELPMID